MMVFQKTPNDILARLRAALDAKHNPTAADYEILAQAFAAQNRPSAAAALRQRAAYLRGVTMPAVCQTGFDLMAAWQSAAFYSEYTDCRLDPEYQITLNTYREHVKNCEKCQQWKASKPNDERRTQNA